MFYWPFTSLVHFWPPTIFNPGYAYDGHDCLLARAWPGMCTGMEIINVFSARKSLSERVQIFRYHNITGWMLACCTEEIRSGFEIAKNVFMKKKKLFTGKMKQELRKRIMKCLVWSVALYAAETWTLIRTGED